MLVKDQLRIRMEEMGISIAELSKRLGVSNQTVRHWLSGRSFPGKSKAPAVEQALSFKLDYSEGAAAQTATVESRMQQTDIETFLAINRLPPEVKLLFGKLAITLNRHFDDAARPAVHAGPENGARKHSAIRERR